jgi:hypothetical protein
MRIGVVIAILIMAAIVQSYAASFTNLTGPIVSAPGFGIIGTVGGINSGGGGSSCAGVINFSTGCTMGMIP